MLATAYSKTITNLSPTDEFDDFKLKTNDHSGHDGHITNLRSPRNTDNVDGSSLIKNVDDASDKKVITSRKRRNVNYADGQEITALDGDDGKADQKGTALRERRTVEDDVNPLKKLTRQDNDKNLMRTRRNAGGDSSSKSLKASSDPDDIFIIPNRLRVRRSAVDVTPRSKNVTFKRVMRNADSAKDQSRKSLSDSHERFDDLVSEDKFDY